MLLAFLALAIISSLQDVTSISIKDAEIHTRVLDSNGTTEKFIVTLSKNVQSGFESFPKDNGFVIVEMNSSSGSPIDLSSNTIYVAVTIEEYDGDAQAASTVLPDWKIVALGSITPSTNGFGYRQTLFFRNLNRNGRVYITITRVVATSASALASAAISYQLLASGVQTLANNIQYTIDKPQFTGRPEYFTTFISPFEDWTINVSQTIDDGTLLFIVICANYPVLSMANPLDKANCRGAIGVKGTTPSVEQFLMDEGVKTITGDVFLSMVLMTPGSSSDNKFNVRLNKNYRVTSGELGIFKIDGFMPYFFSYKLPKFVGDSPADSYEMITRLVECVNCAVCYSFAYTHPNFTADMHDDAKVPQCDVIIGRIYEEDKKYGPGNNPNKTYNVTKVVAVPPGAKWVFGAMVSLDAPGIAEQVEIQTLVQKIATSETPQFVVLGPGGTTEGVTAPDGSTTVYKRAHFRFPLPKNISTSTSNTSYISLLVGPALPDLKTYYLSGFQLYASTKVPCPDQATDMYEHIIYNNTELNTDFQRFSTSGLDVLTFTYADTNDTVLYVTIQTSFTDLMDFVNTSVRLDWGQDVVRRLPYAQAVDTGLQTNKDRVLFHFDVTSVPFEFIVVPCKGMPQVRAGITDYFLRSLPNDSPEAGKIERAERVFNSRLSAKFGRDIIIPFKAGTLANTGTYVIEVSDYRDLQDSFQAEIISSTSDPRPQIAAYKLRFYQSTNGNNLLAKFHPASPAGLFKLPTALEYAIFAMNAQFMDGNTSRPLTTYYNPNSACGYQNGGIQLSEWTTFEEWAEFYDLECPRKAFNTLTAEYIYLTVVARQKGSNMTRVYSVFLYDKKSPLPPYVDPDEAASRVWVPIVITIIVLGILGGGIAMGVIFWYKKHRIIRMKNRSDHAFRELDGAALEDN